MRRLDAWTIGLRFATPLFAPSFDMRMPQSVNVQANALPSASSRSGGANTMHPLLIASKHEDRRRKASPSPAAERKLRALERQRAKLVNVDEMIRLVNRIGLN